MKKTYVLLIILICGLVPISHAQVDTDSEPQDDGMQTLFGDVHSHGGYLGISTLYTQLNNKDGIQIGGRMAYVMNHSLALGFGGYGILTPMDYDLKLDPSRNYEYMLAGGYGGFFIEPILFAKYPVHLAFPFMIGGGGLAYVNTNTDWNTDQYNEPEATEAFFFVEPGIELELSLLKFLRFSAGVHYRYTSPVTLETIDADNQDYQIGSDNMLHGLSAGATLKFGWF